MFHSKRRSIPAIVAGALGVGGVLGVSPAAFADDAADTQMLKEMYLDGNFDKEAAAKVSVFGALTLYLDFINMFQFLLALVGNRNE